MVAALFLWKVWIFIEEKRKSCNAKTSLQKTSGKVGFLANTSVYSSSQRHLFDIIIPACKTQSCTSIELLEKNLNSFSISEESM